MCEFISGVGHVSSGEPLLLQLSAGSLGFVVLIFTVGQTYKREKQHRDL